ncbi:hypothetical protein [Photobacterium sanguinicancri]|nr:hypothetical protein [Photobacterium sanguinicancri]
MESTSPKHPMEREDNTVSSGKESMEDLLERVTKLALDSMHQLSYENND